jgi:SAM-dependent methyltransferase
MDASSLRDELGGMDIYLLDQVTKGRFPEGATILDAGCGAGRNLLWFAHNGYDVYAADADEDSIAALKIRAGGVLPDDHIVHSAIGTLPFEDEKFDAVICIAVLHFMADDNAWEAGVRDLWRVLKPGGFLFARFGTTDTIKPHLQHLKGKRYRIPSGQELYLTDLETLLAMQEKLGAEQIEPIKTVNVQNKRTMTNWILGKPR